MPTQSSSLRANFDAAQALDAANATHPAIDVTLMMQPEPRFRMVATTS
jgi:hypothetical protein